MIGIISNTNKDNKTLAAVAKDVIVHEQQEMTKFLMGFMSPLLQVHAPYMNPRSSIYPHPAQPDFCECL